MKRRRPARPAVLALVAAGLLVLAATGAHAGAAADSSASGTGFDALRLGAGYATAGDLDLASLSISGIDVGLGGPSWLGLDLAVPVEAFVYRDRRRVDMAGDLLVAAGVILPLALVVESRPSCEGGVKVAAVALSPLLLPVVRPTLAVRPVRGVALTFGYDAAYAFTSDTKGIFFTPGAGLRLDPVSAVRLEGGVTRGFFWDWQRADDTMGWGWYARVSLRASLFGTVKPPVADT